ncbi:MAG: TonB-dependent receptor [Bryobacterales bacterium]|nr:TonB-dependent receptor [Bryobacterales bacterium]MBV9398160.1 TonB-dependent receptor [Bryobacterales bacterium]
MRFACVFCIAPSIALFAQTDRSALAGTVADSTGARVPGATVTAVQRATGQERKTETTSQGTYIIDGVPLGQYTITVTKAGFGEYRVTDVEQIIGETRTLNVQLTPSEQSGSTTVSEPLVRVDPSSAAVAASFEQAQLSELPLNGRNWSNLTALSPGAIDNGPSDQRTIRFAGHGLDDNNFLFDGVDASGILNQAQKEYVRLAIPLDSISEFQVQSQNFRADTGMFAGAQMSVASRSGTNALHGGAFDFFRNDVFDARSPLDGPSPDPFLLNQFGGDLGGPIVHGQTFFYANYEGLRQHLGNTQVGLVPSPFFLTQAEIASPSLAPILNAYPKGTSPTSNPQVWNYVAGSNQVDNEDSGMFRADHRFTDRTTAYVRFSADEAVYTLPTGALNALATTDTKLANGVAELFHVFSPSLVNEAKFGFNQDIYHTANISPVAYTVSVSNLSSLTAGSTTDGHGTTFSYIDDMTWVKGKHIVKFGVLIRRINMNQGNSQSGALTYLSLNNFVNNQMDGATYTSLLPLKRLRKTQAYGYLEDTYKATGALTLTLGLRYSFFNVFHEVDNRAIPFDFETCGGYCSPLAQFTFPRHGDLDPRASVAWARGKTVLRAGGGLYHTDGQLDDQNLPISNDVLRYTLSPANSPGLSYPIEPYLANTTGTVTPRDLYRRRKDMYIAAWTASIQRTLLGNAVATVSYVGNKGTDILTTTYTNTINPNAGVAPYPQFGVVSWRGNDSNSTFHALQVNVQRAFQKGWLVAANYMWSHSINDGGIGGGEADTPQNVFCRACEKAAGDYDVRQVFNLSSVYQLPFGPGKPYLSTPGLTRAIFGGWQLSAIATARTGLPVNVVLNRANAALPDRYSVSGSERPDLVPGVPLTPPGGQTPQLWINPAAFAVPAAGAYGNTGRNLVRGPDLYQMDASLSTTIRLKERVLLLFRAEVFNLLNRAQYGQPQANLSSPLSFGEITTPLNSGATGGGTPRQFQLALRLKF